MVIVGILNGVVAICVSILPEQLATVQEMYPDYLFMERTGPEDIDWRFDGTTFTPT